MTDRSKLLITLALPRGDDGDCRIPNKNNDKSAWPLRGCYHRELPPINYAVAWFWSDSLPAKLAMTVGCDVALSAI